MITKVLGKIVYRILWSIGALFFYAPFTIKHAFARGLGWVWFRLIPFRKKIILHNLILVFPRGQGESMQQYRLRLHALCYKNFVHYALSFMETLERFHWNPAVVERRVTVKGLEFLPDLLNQKKSFFVLSSHIGNWELIILVGKKLGGRLAILTKFLRNGFWDQIWVQSRQAFGLELIRERNSGLEIVRSIQRGCPVGFILDQHTGEPHGIESTFLGHKAFTAKGLAILSHRLKAAVLPAFLIRQADGNFILHMTAPFTSQQVIPEKFCIESGPLPNEALEFHVRKCNEIMEQWIYAYPEQYLWLHKRFKNFYNYKAELPWG